MIYFDNAATTFPKPPCVVKAVNEALLRYGANPGRSGHDLSLQTAQKVFECREPGRKAVSLSTRAGYLYQKLYRVDQCGDQGHCPSGRFNVIISGLEPQRGLPCGGSHYEDRV